MTQEHCVLGSNCSSVSISSLMLYLSCWGFQAWKLEFQAWSWSSPFLYGGQSTAVPLQRAWSQLWASTPLLGVGSLVNVWRTLRLKREIDLWHAVILGLSLSLSSIRGREEHKASREPQLLGASYTPQRCSSPVQPLKHLFAWQCSRRRSHRMGQQLQPWFCAPHMTLYCMPMPEIIPGTRVPGLYILY